MGAVAAMITCVSTLAIWYSFNVVPGNTAATETPVGGASNPSILVASVTWIVVWILRNMYCRVSWLMQSSVM